VNDDAPRNPDAGPLAVLARVDQVCDRFEAAWPDPGQQAPRPRIEDYLGETLEPERSQLLTQLLALELEYRRAAGETPLLEDYRARFPDHGAVVRRIFAAPETVAPQPTANPSAAAPPAGGVSPAERFRPLRLHAEGGLGEVHLAQDCELPREVALKRIRDEYADDPDSRHRFLREAEITGGLEHPGIVPVYGLGQGAGGRPYYAMRFIKGDSLKQAIERFHQAEGPKRDPGERSLALRELLGRFVAVCNAVAYAHSRGVVHRDLKPANVMLGPYGETLVVDWGLAKLVGRPESPGKAEATLRPRSGGGQAPTQAGAVIGTPAFMSPEQAAGRSDQLGPASDIYGLGATLYALLTGQPPVPGDDLMAILARVQSGEIVPPRRVKGEVPAALEAVCRKAMALRPQDRYGTALELAADVEHWLADEPVSAHREPWAARAGRWMRRHKPARAAGAAAAVVLLLLGGAGAWWLERQQAERQAEQARQEGALRQEGAATLEQATRLRRGGHFDESRQLLERARQRLEDGGPDDLRQEVEQALADTALARRLDEARQQASTVAEGELDVVGARQSFAAALREAGLVRLGDGAEEAGARVRASAVRAEVVAALEAWASLTGDDAQRGWLLAVARAADPSPARDRLRQPRLWRDRAALARLAAGDSAAALSPQLTIALAYALVRSGGDAVPLLRAAQARHPDDFWLNFELGVALAGAKQWDEAVGHYRAALAVRPRSSAVYNNLGLALAGRGQMAEAIRHFEEALRIAPKLADAHTSLGLALQAQGRLAEAIRHFEQALRLDPKNAKAHGGLGNALQAQGRLAEAISHYQQALRLDPKDTRARTNLGAALVGRGQMEEAIRTLEEALGLDPKEAGAHYNLGNALQAQGRLAEAISHFEQALRLDPKNAKAHNNLGFALYNSGQVAEAISHFEQALRLDPKDVQAHKNLGLALAIRGQVGEAISHFEQALRLDPKLADADTSLGLALQAQGRLAEAISHFEQALRLDPKDAVAHWALGGALLRQGCFAEARKATRRCLDLMPQGHPLRLPATRQLQQCERFLTLEKKLPAVLKGEAHPATAAERIDLAQLCQEHKHLFVAAARFYTAAFAAEPKLADDLRSGHRYNAACAAALAAAGKGEDAAKLADQERAKLRQQALTWLQADLAAWTHLAEKGPPQSRSAVQRKLRHWQQDPALAAVRGSDALAKLPAAEHDAWKKLWAEVDALLKRVQDK
jgi:tetratricopeptide (TPR) repeat protein/tRNA A-37 threonylcarbamoyl transferase component Bud32